MIDLLNAKSRVSQGKIGSAGRTRTYNPRINSALLHH
jgi:hypothetical protein